MKLERLVLRNFKKVRSLELDVNGRDMRATGRNGAGKTTIADAIMWILFDKDTLNRKSFGIKTLVDGVAIPELEHEVEAVFSFADDVRVAFRKVYKEVRETKRGHATKEFTGHTTDHFVDDVPVTKTAYDKRVAEIMDENTFRLLTDPLHFNQNLKWQDRRRILLEVCGDISDEDVIASDDALADLPSILGKNSLDDQKAITVARRAKINTEIQQLPVRIDEVDRQLTDLPDVNEIAVKAELEAAQADRAAAAERLAAAKAGTGDAATERRALRDIEDALLDLEAKHRRKGEDAIRAHNDAITDAERRLQEARRNVERLEARAAELEADASGYEPRIQALRDEYAEVKKRAVDPDVEDVCPACKRELPKDQVQAATIAALGELNVKKAQQLERIQADAARLKDRQAAATSEAKLERNKAAGQRNGLTALEEELENLKAKPVPAPQDATQTPAYAKLAAERTDLERKIAAVTAADPQVTTDLESQVRELDTVIANLQGELASVQQRAGLEARRAELAGQEKTLATEFEKLERHIHLMELFLRKKVELLDERINSHFKVVRFKLFEEQVTNDGLREMCEATYNGVPYGAGVSQGERINAGLDIINTLADHHAFWPLIVIDGAEGVTELLPTVGQQIALHHNADVPELRIDYLEPTTAPEEVAA